MTEDEAMNLIPGDMVFVPQKGIRDWPESYNEIVGGVYPVKKVSSETVDIAYRDRIIRLYFEEVVKACPEIQDDFDDSDIKLLFGGEI